MAAPNPLGLLGLKPPKKVYYVYLIRNHLSSTKYRCLTSNGPFVRPPAPRTAFLSFLFSVCSLWYVSISPRHSLALREKFERSLKQNCVLLLLILY